MSLEQRLAEKIEEVQGQISRSYSWSWQEMRPIVDLMEEAREDLELERRRIEAMSAFHRRLRSEDCFEAKIKQAHV